MLSNELPRLNDASGALSSRFVIVTLQNSFLGKEDHGLKDRLLGELPGIFNWAIQGWRDLNQRGYFVEPASSRDAVEELAALTSPTRRFVGNRCTVGPGKTVGVGDIYAAWKL
ncbi:hypothetical protein [Caballeronia sp. M23-90]